MNIIFLNAWNAEVRDAIADFIVHRAPDTDVFCFQEAHQKMQKLCTELLPDYSVALHRKLVEGDYYTQATYAKRELAIDKTSIILEKSPHTGFGLYTEISNSKHNIHICNIHGISRPGEKQDTPERINQTEGILRFFNDLEGIKIIGGDFNLEPDTKSIEMFEERGYRNLIKDFHTPTTRNRLSWEKYPDNKQYFADYIFVSPSVRIIDFSVPNIEISDHLPMLLSIQL